MNVATASEYRKELVVRVCVESDCDQEARPKGPECRTCYKRNHKRNRRAQKSFENRTVSLDSAAFQLERKRYDEWHLNED